MTRGQRIIAFIERYCLVPEGKHVGKPIKLEAFQRDFILAVYDNPKGTSRGYLSIARKNGKSALIGALVLAHIVGPEARLNSQIISGARSRDQASLVFKLAEKMIRLSPELSGITKIVPSSKQIIGLPMNVDYRAIAAEAGTAHGLSPALAILDEVGQVKGPYDAFIEAIETAQGAHDNPLLLAISTQAATDSDLFSVWLDDAISSEDPTIVCHLHSAPEDADLLDKEAWAKANPALGKFLNEKTIAEAANKAHRMPSSENTFRWLHLNQRISSLATFIVRSVWEANACAREGFVGPTYCGLDLSSVNDLTAAVFTGEDKSGKTAVLPYFWLPEYGLEERSRSDRVPYDLWKKQGFLRTTPGKSVDYDFVAAELFSLFNELGTEKCAYDRFNIHHLRPRMVASGFTDADFDEDDGLFVPFGQGYVSMSPALRDLEGDLLEERIAHEGHPVLSMCASNAIVTMDPAGNRKLDKAKATGRIDGMVALAMAHSTMKTHLETQSDLTPWDSDPDFKLAV